MLTAAHCCDGSLGYFDVILGSQAQSQTEAHEFKTGQICYRATKMSSENLRVVVVFSRLLQVQYTTIHSIGIFNGQFY